MKIAVVSDREPGAAAIARALRGRPQDQMTWVASSGEEALLMCARDTPDLLLMGLITTGMDGVEATRQIMRANPCAILIMAASLDRDGRHVLEALGEGALDVVEFTGEDGLLCMQTPLLLSKIDTIARLVGEHRPQRGAGSTLRAPR